MYKSQIQHLLQLILTHAIQVSTSDMEVLAIGSFPGFRSIVNSNSLFGSKPGLREKHRKTIILVENIPIFPCHLFH
jgi:hypothetical protein